LGKVDVNEMLQLREQGWTQTALAERYGVSQPRIAKLIRRACPPPEPECMADLTPQERTFVKAKAVGVSNTQAAFMAYECKDRASAKSLGSITHKRPRIQAAIREWLEHVGLTPEYRAARLKSCTDSKDPNVILKALDQSHRILGDYSPERQEVRLRDEEIRAFIASIRVMCNNEAEDVVDIQEIKKLEQ